MLKAIGYLFTFVMIVVAIISVMIITGFIEISVFQDAILTHRNYVWVSSGGHTILDFTFPM